MLSSLFCAWGGVDVNSNKENATISGLQQSVRESMDYILLPIGNWSHDSKVAHYNTRQQIRIRMWIRIAMWYRYNGCTIYNVFHY